jgi:hypothetical protein
VALGQGQPICHRCSDVPCISRTSPRMTAVHWTGEVVVTPMRLVCPQPIVSARLARTQVEAFLSASGAQERRSPLELAAFSSAKHRRIPRLASFSSSSHRSSSRMPNSSDTVRLWPAWEVRRGAVPPHDPGGRENLSRDQKGGWGTPKHRTTGATPPLMRQ